MTPRALFVCGSINQTKQLLAVARQLPQFAAYFTPYYGDAGVEWMRRLRMIESSIGGDRRRAVCFDYLREQRVELDVNGRNGGYELVVTCTDLMVQRNLRNSKVVVVQEGIFDPDGWRAWVLRRARFLPRWLAGTALTGESFLYDRFCAASDGYRERLIARGADPDKVVVTGIPGFDDCTQYANNDFPHRGYVLACTSDFRETFQPDNRRKFIRRCLDIAGGRQLIFKLHPNEDAERARREIAKYAPSALVYDTGSAEEMIANSDVLITQWSTTAFVGVALGKEVHSNCPSEELRRLCPWQNGGTAASRIAAVCRELIGLEHAGAPIAEAVLSTSLGESMSRQRVEPFAVSKSAS